MPIMISRRRLAPGELDAWKTRFEVDAENRKNAGCRGVRRFRSKADPDELIVIFDWESQALAERFVADKFASRPGLADGKRADGTAAFTNEFYEELPSLIS